MLNRFLYKSYRFFYLWETWWRRRFTTAGLFFISIAGISAILGVDTTRNMIFQIFSFSTSILILSVCWSFCFKTDIKIKRRLPRFVTAGEPFRYSIFITNLSGSFEKDLSLFENPRDPRPDFYSFINAREPEEESRNFWDRKVLYYRWLWLVRQNQKAWLGENRMPDIPPGETVLIDAELKPVTRGYIYFSGVTIARTDPFRLFRAFQKKTAPQQLLVLPKRYPVPEISLPGTRKYHSGGIAMASAIGNSDEFMSLREFQPGDPVRHIHWKSWAKTGDLIIREFQDEYYTRHALILDTYDEQPYTPVFEEAVSIAASFVGAFQVNETILDLMFVGSKAYIFSGGRGLLTTEQLMETLACVGNEKNKNIDHIIPMLKRYIRLLSGSICVFLKWDEKRRAVYDFLHMSGNPVLAMVVTENKSESEAALGSYADSIHIIGTDTVKEDLMSL